MVRNELPHVCLTLLQPCFRPTQLRVTERFGRRDPPFRFPDPSLQAALLLTEPVTLRVSGIGLRVRQTSDERSEIVTAARVK